MFKSGDRVRIRFRPKSFGYMSFRKSQIEGQIGVIEKKANNISYEEFGALYWVMVKDHKPIRLFEPDMRLDDGSGLSPLHKAVYSYLDRERAL